MLGVLPGNISLLVSHSTAAEISVNGPGLYFLREESSIGAVAIFTCAFATNQARVLADGWDYFSSGGFFTLSKPELGYNMTISNPTGKTVSIARLNFG